MFMNIQVLDSPALELGEGIYFCEETANLFFVNILDNVIYSYNIIHNKLTKSYKVKNNPSCIFNVSGDYLFYVDRIGVNKLNLLDGSTSLVSIHLNHDPKSYRANDGVMLSDGSFLYGTMSNMPEAEPGKLHLFQVNGENRSYDLDIHIPNTFIQTDGYIYISDSFKKHMYILNLDVLYSGSVNVCDLKLWMDFTGSNFTPDGGCISDRGFLHVALWGGASVAVFNKSGQLMQRIALPVLQPTNCELYDNRWLYVTSACEGMSMQQLEKYPLSGKTFVVDLGDRYEY